MIPGVASQRPIALHTDFACPFCHVLNERIVDAELEAEFEWRGIQLDATLPVPMVPARPELGLELDRDLVVLAERAPECRMARPVGKPNTGAANLWTSAAERVDPGRARVFRRALYHALWTQGRDLSVPEVLDVLRQLAELPVLSIEEVDKRRTTEWQRSWFANVRLAPAMIARSGERYIGLPSTTELRSFVDRVRGRVSA